MHLIFRDAQVLTTEDGVLYTPRHPPDGALDPPGGPLTVPGGDGAVRILHWPAEEPRAGEAVAGPVNETAAGAEAAGAAGSHPVFRPLRQALGLLDDAGAALAGRARQLLQWRLDHRFCGTCGEPTRLAERGSALVCTGCGREHFPRVTPAVIVLVHDGRRILLGRAPRFPDGMYSTLAGFVEPGESAEACVHREVLEESGVRVTELAYRGSQSWPFPHSLMLGYHARYAGGRVRCDDEELEDVAWFDIDDLPRLPTHRSIARSLIESWRAHINS